MQARNEMIGLTRPLGEVFDLIVLDQNLATEERDLAVLFTQACFELLDVLCRDRSRQVGACRCPLAPIENSRRA